MAPELVREFVQAFQEEANRFAARQQQEQASAKRRLKELDRKISALVKAIEDGRYSAALADRLAALEAERAELSAQQTTGPSPNVWLHPRLGEVYAEKVAGLEAALNDPAIRTEAAGILRGLIDRVELLPSADGRTLDAILHGDLASILNMCEAARRKDKKALLRRASLARTPRSASDSRPALASAQQRC